MSERVVSFEVHEEESRGEKVFDPHSWASTSGRKR